MEDAQPLRNDVRSSGFGGGEEDRQDMADARHECVGKGLVIALKK